MTTKKCQIKEQKFICHSCNFICSKKSNYNTHLKTAKHQRTTLRLQKEAAALTCECGKIYSCRQNLYRHKARCFFLLEKNADLDDSNIDTDMESKPTNTMNIMMDLIKQNQEFKDLLIEQQKENHELQKQIIDKVNINNVTNNNNIINNNNQKFNLNFFLNTTCKDAMNMSEFIENINIDLHELEDIGRQGYVTGMTNMILSRIKDMDVTKRPLHCTDLKRETMYIKENDEWSKETPDNIRLRNMIKIVGNNNMTALPAWREKHPECQISEHPQYEFCIDMMRNILGDVGEDQKKLENKVIKNLSRHLLVNKGL